MSLTGRPIISKCRANFPVADSVADRGRNPEILLKITFDQTFWEISRLLVRTGQMGAKSRRKQN